MLKKIKKYSLYNPSSIEPDMGRWLDLATLLARYKAVYQAVPDLSPLSILLVARTCEVSAVRSYQQYEVRQYVYIPSLQSLSLSL